MFASPSYGRASKGADTLGNFAATTAQQSCRQQITVCQGRYLLHTTTFVAFNMLPRIDRLSIPAMKHQRCATCCMQQYFYNTLGDLLPATVACNKVT